MILIINLIIIYHSRMLQAFRFIEISKYDDGGQLLLVANLHLEAVQVNLYNQMYNQRTEVDNTDILWVACFTYYTLYI